MQIKVIQTSDVTRYARMLRSTSRTAVEFCRRHDLQYEQYIGVKRGFHPAHATYNRIPWLMEMIAYGYEGWVLYMDADAYIYDLDFDIRAYLEAKSDRAAVIATIYGETVPWHVNAGVLLINLGHPQGRALVKGWSDRFMAIGDDVLQSSKSVWDAYNDQLLLYITLRDTVEIRDAVFFEEAMKLNDVNGVFIRQYLAAFDADLNSRTEAIELKVEAVMATALTATNKAPDSV